MTNDCSSANLLSITKKSCLSASQLLARDQGDDSRRLSILPSPSPTDRMGEECMGDTESMDGAKRVDGEEKLGGGSRGWRANPARDIDGHTDIRFQLGV